MNRDPSFSPGIDFDDISERIGDSEAANSYVSVRNFRFLRREVLKLLGEVKGKRVLDAGCGTGHFSWPLVGANFVFGVDLSSKMLAFARNKGLSPVRSLAQKLPFRDGSFDIVLANSVIQLIADGGSLIQDLVRVTGHGGRLIISTINAENVTLGALRFLEKKKYRHFRLYPPDDLKGFVAAAGGEVRASHFLYYPFGRTSVVPDGIEPGVLPRRFATTVIIDALRL